jgi:hypothetical protein
VSANFGGYGDIAAYSGGSFGDLTEVGCRNFSSVLTFHVNAGSTYYLQLVPFDPIGDGQLSLSLDVAPTPTASFSYYPSDPSSFDTIQFYDQSYDSGQVGFSSETWSFGDGTTASNSGCCPTHHYTADGDYTVGLTVTTTDGRTASTSQVVHVRTHDVAIAKFTAPQSANAGQTKQITASISNSRYPETVQVQLFKSNTSGGFDLVGTLNQSVTVKKGNQTTPFTFNYTFTSTDATAGKVTFEATATIIGARDALPADNTAIALPTKVSH